MRKLLTLAAVVATLAMGRQASAQGNVIQGGGAGASQRNFSLNFGGGGFGGVGAAFGRGFSRVGIGGGLGLGFGRGLAFGRGIGYGGFNRGFVGARAFAPVYVQRQPVIVQQQAVYAVPQQVIVQQAPVYSVQQFAAPAYDVGVGCGVQTFSRGIRAQVGGCQY